MTRFDEPAAGLWSSSYSDDAWSGDAFFDSREEAIANAVAEEHRYIGRAYPLTDDEVAEAFVRDWDDADEVLCQQDEWAWREEPVIRKPSDESREELHQMVKAWVAKHSLREPTWRVEEIEGPFDWSTAQQPQDGAP